MTARSVLAALLLAGCGSSTPSDGGSDAGFDAGRADAGFDGGFDAGTDAGTDAGRDSGVGEGSTCTPEVRCGTNLECVGGPACSDPWRCEYRPCSDGFFFWCGCDGVTFSSPSSCVNRPYLHAGPCAGAEGFDCDPAGIWCPEKVDCPPGQVASVAPGICRGFCVPLTDCACTDDALCPGDATCDLPTTRCRP